MNKKNVAAAVIVLLAVLLGGCGNKGDVQEPDSAADTAVISETDQENAEESVSETTPEASKEENPESSEGSESEQLAAELADGIYTADFPGGRLRPLGKADDLAWGRLRYRPYPFRNSGDGNAAVIAVLILKEVGPLV